MFLDRLAAPEREALLSVAARLLAVDGVNDAEWSALSALTAQAGVGPRWAPDTSATIDALLGRIQKPTSRRAALLELLGLAHADRTYADEERAFIEHAAEVLAISPTTLALMENWVVRQLALAREAELLLRGR